MDFVTSLKKENSIKTVYIDNNLASKHIYKNNIWVPVCIKENCVKYVVKNDLCNKHLKEQQLIEEGTIVIKSGIYYVWSNYKWSIKCEIVTCKFAATKTGYCTDHDSFKNTINKFSSVTDIYKMAMLDPRNTEL